MSMFATNGVTLRQIRAFIAVSKVGSFTQAADMIGLTQPALTSCVRQLEEQIGVALFDRTTRRVELTIFGEEFLPAAERIVRELETSMQALHALHSGRRGHVSLTSIGSIASSLLPLALGNFKAQHPEVGIELSEDHSEGVRRKVLEGEAEFGLSGVTEPVVDVDARPFFRDRIGLFCRRDHPLAQVGEPLTWSRVNGLEILNMGYEAQIRTVAEVEPDVALTLSTPTYKVRNTLAIVAMLREGRVVAALPNLSVPRSELSDIVFRPLSRPSLHREIYLCQHVRTRLSAAATALIAMIRDSAVAAGADVHPLVEPAKLAV